MPLQTRDRLVEAGEPGRISGTDGVPLRDQPVEQVGRLGDLGRRPLLAERVAGRDDEPDRRDLATTAAAAMAARGGVVVLPIQQHALEVAAFAQRRGVEPLGRVGRLGEEREPVLQDRPHGGVLLGRHQRVRAADLDALQTAGALPRVDGRREQSAGTRLLLLQRVEERAAPGDRVGAKVSHQGTQRARVFVAHDAGARLGDDVGEHAVVLLGAEVGRPHRRRQFGDGRLQSGLAVGVQHRAADAGVQQVVELEGRIGDGGVRAHEGALHTPRAQIGLEHRHGPPEEPLVLRGRRPRGHEQARARQHRRLPDGAVAEMAAAHQVVVAVVEQAGRRSARRAAVGHLRREGDRAQRQRGGEVADGGQVGPVVVDGHGGVRPVEHDGHVGVHDRLALRTPLLGDLGAHLGHDLVARRPGGHLVDVRDDGTDERDAHHARLERGIRGVLLRHVERVDDVEPNPLVPDRAPGAGGQFAPHLVGGEARLEDERATVDEALERVGVAEHLVVGADDDLDILQLGVGDEHRFGAQGDVVVGRRAGFLRAVLGRRLGIHAEHTGQNVGEQLAGRDGAVAADRVEAKPQRGVRKQRRVGLGLQRHLRGERVGGPEPVLDLLELLVGVGVEELAAEVDERRHRLSVERLEGRHEVPWLQIVAAEAEDRAGEVGHRVLHRRNAVVADLLDVVLPLVDGCGHELGERHLVGPFQHEHRLLAVQGGDEFGLGEGLEALHRHESGLDAQAAHDRQDGAHVVRDRAERHHDDIGVVAVIRHDRRVRPSGEFGVLVHGAPDEPGHVGGEMGPVVDGPGLEVRLVLHRAGEAGVVGVHERGHQLAGALRRGLAPLASPGGLQIGRDPPQCGPDAVAGGVRLDRVGIGLEVLAQGSQGGGVEPTGAARCPGVQLRDAPLGAEQDFLGDRRAGDAAGGVAEVFAQQRGLGQERLAHHVARGEAVHGVGDGDEAERRGAVRDGREIGRLLRVGAEEHRVAGRQQGVHVVVAGHHVERVLAHHARRHLQDEPAHLLAHRHEVGLHRVENPLAGGGVRDELATRQRRPQRARLRRVFPLGFEEERVLPEHVDATGRPGRLERLRDLGRRGDRVADHAPADMAHDVGDRPVAMDDRPCPGVLRFAHDRSSRRAPMLYYGP